MRKLLFIAIFACTSITTLAQGFPWEIFKARTLKEVISITTKAVRPDDSMFLATNLLESKMEVTFTGQSRPILQSHRDFINMWVGIFGRPKEYASLYEREYLYKEGKDEYWLATQTPITKYFDKELGPGDKMTLYLISIGAYRSEKSINCVLLVEEYKCDPCRKVGDPRLSLNWFLNLLPPAKI